MEREIGIEAFAVLGFTTCGVRPLGRAIVFEILMAQSGDIAGTTRTEFSKFSVDICTVFEPKFIFKAQSPPDFGKYFPIGFSFTRRRSKGGTEGNCPLGIGHHACLFAPLGSGEKDVSVFSGFGRVVGILMDRKRRSQ